MATKARTTTGTTFTLGTADYPVEKVRIGSEGMESQIVDATHLESTWVEKLVDEIKDAGRLTFDTNIEPDKFVELFAAMGVPQEGTLTFKTIGSETAGATLVGQAALIEHTFDGPVREKISGTMTVEWLGEVTPTAATSS